MSINYNDQLVERVQLPAFRPESNFSLWKILRDSIGKDLSKFAVPVYMNEPISMLQRVGEFV